jgi:hypothetical protein
VSQARLAQTSPSVARRQSGAREDREGDARQIGVALGHGLRPHLHETEHGQQQHQIGDERGQELAALALEHPAHSEHARRGDQTEGEGGRRGRIRVERPQLGRPQGLAEVGHRGLQRDRESLVERHVGQRAHGAGGVLRVPSNDRRGSSQEHEGYLLGEHTAETGAPQAREGIGVEQEQHQRKANRHGLRQQRQPEAEQRGQVPAPGRGRRRVVEIGEKSEQEEQGAQELLALRYPGRRLHAQGMQPPQESGGNAGGQPSSAAKALAGSRTEQGDRQQDHQPGAEAVQKEASQVMPGGPGAEDGEVHGMRQVAERVPVATAVETGKGGGPGPA